jgi:DNA-binding IscR family transcriptional regulator
MGETVTRRDVSALVGRDVPASTVRDAAHRLRRSLPIVSVRGPGGGYRLSGPAGRAEQ